jgi:molybdate transport system substrate-binding protein
MTQATDADAAEIKVLTSVALTSALDELAPQFERATGNKLTIGYALIAEIRKRILEGESADVIILSRPVMDELQKQDKVAAGPITNVVGTAVAVAAKAGGRVEDGRGSLGPKASAPFPIPAHRTGRADLRHPALRLASP